MALEDERPGVVSGAGHDEEDGDRSWPGIVKLVLGALLVAGVVGLIWYAYNLGLRNGSESVAPIVRAGDGPLKEAPEDPGGLDVPNQDMDVYETIEGEGGVERYVPPEPPQRAQAGGEAQSEQPQQTADAGATDAPAPDGEPKSEPEAPPAPKAQEQATPAEEEPPQVASAPPADKAEPETEEGDRAPTTAELIGPYRVQLAAFRSPEEATRTWQRLQKNNKDLLGKLDLIIQKVDLGEPKGVFYRLQAAPLKSREAAESLCGKLVDRQVSCIVVKA